MNIQNKIDLAVGRYLNSKKKKKRARNNHSSTGFKLITAADSHGSPLPLMYEDSQTGPSCYEAN